MQLNITFSNVSQCFVYAGKNTRKETVFTGLQPSLHAAALAAQNPDICGIAEMLISADEDCSVIQKFSEILGLEYFKFIPTEKSWLAEGYMYGLALFSRFPILEYTVVDLPNPDLEFVQPNGDLWTTHTKVAQQAVVSVDGAEVQVTNLHSYPVHRFNRCLDEPYFDEFREKVAGVISASSSMPSIVMGDFNNANVAIEKAFPDVFGDGGLQNAVVVPSEILSEIGDKTQLDYILISQHFELKSETAQLDYSDHPTVSAQVSLL